MNKWTVQGGLTWPVLMQGLRPGWYILAVQTAHLYDKLTIR